ncbi:MULTISPECIES: AAA family ATPase [Nostocales]|uniref:ATP-binding protein n=3 Tax=Nostocales TaxID=1161 RepID=A0A0C1QTC7_9CYAN|nr:ATP-binding protein [Tolypothrix bouteillei]KAF3889469.1 ATP-binding protein [Tolypothrix bouteillei VB521301]
MLSKIKVQHYKSLFDTEVDLEPFTVFIGPNGSGKSNICEALAVLSNFLQRLISTTNTTEVIQLFAESLTTVEKNQQSIESKFWHGKRDYLLFEVSTLSTAESTLSNKSKNLLDLSLQLNYQERRIDIKTFEKTRSRTTQYTQELREFLVVNEYRDSFLANALKKVNIYDFAPVNLSIQASLIDTMDRTGQGIAYALVDILHANRKSFDELEDRLRRLVPNIQRIVLPRGTNQTFLLELIDKYSEHHIPASDISDGTLRILAFLTALYQENTPSIICFEEIENGVHPWLLHKMVELLKIVSIEGITGKPVQVLITTHSPVLLNYVEPHEVRAVELDNEGKTQVHALPTDSIRFQKALEAYDGALGELWFSNIFGGNPV